MRKANLANPPVFAVSAQARGTVTLTADTGAIAHVFVVEEDIMRVLLLADGTPTSAPSWAIAPGASDIAEPGRDRMSLEGFTCPDYTLHETDTTITIATTRLRLAIARTGLISTWYQKQGDDWQLIAQDRPTQAYNFGWWDDATYHYVCRQPGERYYALGEKAGAMDRAGRRLRLTNLDPMGYDASANDPLYKSIPYVLVVNAEARRMACFTTPPPTRPSISGRSMTITTRTTATSARKAATLITRSSPGQTRRRSPAATPG
jgi:alpha-glucosidase